MADISYQQVAATLASGLLTATAAHLASKTPGEQASSAIEVYHECLKQLQEVDPITVVLEDLEDSDAKL